MARRDDHYDVAESIPFDNENNDFDSDNVQAALEEIDFRSETKEPTGFVDTYEHSNISFVDATRTFTIEPKVTSFTYFIRGREYVKTSAESVVISDIEGIHFIYYSNGTLVSSTTPWSFEDSVAFVAALYWDATDNKAILINEERHGLVMDWGTHEYLHNTRGFTPKENQKVELLNFVTNGVGATDVEAKFGISEGIYFDEDIQVNVVNSATPTADFEQTISPYIQMPIFYKINSGDWRIKDPDAYPIIWDGINPISYNHYDSGTNTWSLQYATSGNYVGVYVFASDNILYPYVGILGHLDAGNAADAISTDLQDITEGLPLQEFYPLFRIVYKTDINFLNEPLATTINFSDGATGSADTDRYAFLASYNGNANVGRYLEVFPGESSDVAPFPIPEDAYLRIASIKAVAASTGAIAIYESADLVNPIASVPFSGGVFNQGTFTEYLPAGSSLAFKVITSSVNKPKIVIWIQTNFG